jgi:hypothetical protein
MTTHSDLRFKCKCGLAVGAPKLNEEMWTVFDKILI